MMPAYSRNRWSCVFFIVYLSIELYFIMNLVGRNVTYSLLFFFFPFTNENGCWLQAYRWSLSKLASAHVIRPIDKRVSGSHLWNNHTTESWAYNYSYTKLTHLLRIDFFWIRQPRLHWWSYWKIFVFWRCNSAQESQIFSRDKWVRFNSEIICHCEALSAVCVCCLGNKVLFSLLSHLPLMMPVKTNGLSWSSQGYEKSLILDVLCTLML